MFFDDSVPMRFDTENNRHRKIVYYDTTYGDREDGVWHGTHMAGTLAGEEDRGSSSYAVPEGWCFFFFFSFFFFIFFFVFFF